MRNDFFVQTFVNLIPIIIVLVIDSTIYIFKLLTKFEKHKTKFAHHLSGMLKYSFFASFVYWVSSLTYYFLMMPSMNKYLYIPGRMTHNDVSALNNNYIGVWIFQFFLSKGIFSKGKSFFKTLGIYGFKLIKSSINNKRFVEIDRSDFSMSKI